MEYQQNGLGNMKKQKLTKKILKECICKKDPRKDISNYIFTHEKLRFSVGVEASSEEEALNKLIDFEV